MAVKINLEFTTSTLNTSLQVGDNIYYTLAGDIKLNGGFATTATPSFLGTVVSTDILGNGLTRVTVLDSVTPGGGVSPVEGGGAYFSFSKSGKVNQNELIGYWASVEFVNNSRVPAKLFAVGTEVHENSK